MLLSRRFHFSPLLRGFRAGRNVYGRNVYTRDSKEVIDAEYVSGDEAEILGSDDEEEILDRNLSVAERVKSLLELRISGTLSSLAIKMKSTTTNGKEDDPPPSDSPPLWASVMPYMIHDSKPVFGVFPTEKHAVNLYLHEKASLVVYSLTPAAYNPAKLPIPRANISGIATPVAESELEEVQNKFEQVHPGSKEFVQDYNYFSLTPQEVAFFNQGELSIVDMEEYNSATADAVSVNSRKLLSKFNGEKFLKFLPSLCYEYANEEIKNPILYHIDRYGFNVLATSAKGAEHQEFRFPFPFEMKTAEEAADAMEEAIQNVKK